MGTFLTNGSLLEDIREIITSASPLLLTSDAATVTNFVGTVPQEVRLPNAMSLVAGVHYLLLNNSSSSLTVKDFDGTVLTTILPSYYTDFRLLSSLISAGKWMQETEDAFCSLLRILPHPLDLSAVTITGASRTLANGIVIGQELEGYAVGFGGSSMVSFSAGDIKDAEGGALGLNFTPPVIPLNEYLWYSLVAEYTGVSAGKVSLRLRATPAAASAALPDDAIMPRFPFVSRIIKLGFVLVKNDGGTVKVTTIRQLGVSGGGGGGGGGGGSLAILAETALSRCYPVSVTSLGTAAVTDITSEDSAYAVCGVVQEDAASGATVSILTSGAVLMDVPAGLGLTGLWGKPVFISPNGTLTIIKPQTGTSPFIAGHFIVRMGVLVKNTEGTTDLLVNPQVIGQLG